MSDRAFRDCRIEVEPGVEIFTQISGADDAQTIVFSNSLASDAGMWDEVIALLPSDMRVIRYDTRGHGRSDAPTTGWSIDRLGQDVVEILNKLSVPKAHFCGLSIGGMTGMWLALNAPSLLRSLTLANTASSFPPAHMWFDRAETVRRSGVAQLVPSTLERWFTERYRSKSPTRVAGVGDMIVATSVEGYAGGCNVLAETDLIKTLPSVKTPTLVIAGTFDPSTSVARAQELCGAIPGSALVEVPAAHISAIEAPRAFADALMAHINQHSG